MIDLDQNATTRPDPAVVDAMLGVLRGQWHNPSSVHRAGQEARRVVELARQSVADLIGARAKEITFCSGGTEALDLAIRGVVGRERGPGAGLPVIVTTGVEHAAVGDLVAHLVKEGAAEARYLPLDGEGVVDVARAKAALDGRVRLLSVQWCNNETGAIQPVRELAEAARRRAGERCVVHSDGAQWVGKMPADVSGGWLDLLTFAPHKFHGPMGVGVLWARPGVALAPRILGTQEQGRRGGTENVPGIAGAGAAAEAARAFLGDPGAHQRLANLRDTFEERVLAAVTGARVNGPRDHARRVWNTTNIAFPRLEAEALLLMLSERGVAASAGAACSSGSLEPSPVLLAMGVPEEVAHGSLRFSIGRGTTGEELETAARVVVECARRLGA